MLKFSSLSVIVLLFATGLQGDELHTDIAIIEDELQINLMFDQCSRMTPTFRTGYRKLDWATVEKIEAALPAALQKFANHKTININDYKRQYSAFEHLRRQLVYVNGLHKQAIKAWAAEDETHKTLLNDWQHRAISVCGGGQNYWGALYDEQNNVISEILFNGKAKSRQ